VTLINVTTQSVITLEWYF